MSCPTVIKMGLESIEWHLMEAYDVYVSFEKDGLDEYWFDPDNYEQDKGVVSINSKEPLEHQLHTLLHEAGHVALRVAPDSFRSPFPPLCRNTVAGRLEILREEVLAWDKAEHIAELLSIRVDENNWKNSYKKALEKYVRWTIKEIQDDEE